MICIMANTTQYHYEVKRTKFFKRKITKCNTVILEFCTCNVQKFLHLSKINFPRCSFELIYDSIKSNTFVIY